MKHGNKAFTLIELLVVIAIIAILAAILFPVFAQAKEAAKKTASLSNTKQSATAIAIYTGDADDNYPGANAVDIDGTNYPDAYIAVPANATGTADAHYYEGSAFNSAQPYMKNYALFEAPGITQTPVYPESIVANAQKVYTNMAFNGLLQYYSATAVAQPSRLPLYSPINGKENLKNFAAQAPTLRCTGKQVCRFNPGAMPQSDTPANARGDVAYLAYTKANDTVWIYGQGMNISYCDTSAKFRKLGAKGVGIQVNSYDDPGAVYGAAGYSDGFLASLHRCQSSAGAPLYSSFYRPDSEFNYKFGTAATSCTQ